jgi:hypothetical protein
MNFGEYEICNGLRTGGRRKGSSRFGPRVSKLGLFHFSSALAWCHPCKSPRRSGLQHQGYKFSLQPHVRTIQKKKKTPHVRTRRTAGIGCASPSDAGGGRWLRRWGNAAGWMGNGTTARRFQQTRYCAVFCCFQQS